MKLDERATAGKGSAALLQIAAAAPSVAIDAKLLARSLAANEGDPAGISADEALGIVTNVAVLGPFRDTGGGLDRKDGPEATGAFADAAASYAWGTVDVRWRVAPRAAATASGLPLDVMVAPRRESCSFVATKLVLEREQSVVTSLAASGQVSLAFDGNVVAKNEDVYRSAMFDRVSAKFAAKKGDHLLVAKVCSGALDDDGRVRLRVTDDKGASLAARTSAALMNVNAEATANASPGRAGGQAAIVGRADGQLAALGRAGSQPTALSRAFAKKPTTASTVLDAAILQTLGGADDLRSPRAPGLLDRITNDPASTPDALAMAGFIAPSGANRSGWLDHAHTLSLKKDASVEAFTMRRLVAERAQGGMGDWAHALWASNRPADADLDAEAILLDALTLEALGSEVSRAQARVNLFAAFSRAKDKAPAAMIMELARQTRNIDATAFAEAEAELARRGYGGIDVVLSKKIAGVTETANAARHAFEAASFADQDEGVAIVDAVVDAGDHKTALDLALRLVAFAPNSDAAWSRVADEIAVERGAQDPAVITALQRARALAPGEARYRALAKLRQKTDGREGFHADEKYLATSESILARRLGVPQGVTDVADRELHWLRAVTLHPDGRVSQLIHYAREIVIPPRTESELYEELPLEGDLAEILRARVHRKSGGVAYPTEEHNEGTRPRVRWPELFAGDTVEVALRVWTSTAVGGRGDAPFYFLDYAGAVSTHPLLYNEVIVDTPKDKPLYVDLIHQDPTKVTVEKKEEAGHLIAHYTWQKPVVIPEEPLAPQLSEIVPVIVGSTFRTWKDFRAWYSEAVRGFTEPDEQVIRMAKELTKGKVTREDKLAALFNFVSDDIRYVNYVSGEWWLPNRPQQLLARREGDCDDKALLLITLLKAVGIEAEEVMVQTRLTAMPSVVLAKNVAVPMFDHGIAFLPGPNGGTYLDATSPESRLGPLPSMDAHAVALRLSQSDDIVELPASRPEDHGADVKWTVKLDAQGNADLDADERDSGDGAFYLRTYLTQADARAQYVENNLLAGWFPTVELDKQIDFEPNLKDGAARVRYKAKSQGYARREKDELVVPLSPAQTLASQLAPLVRRTQPVELPPYTAPSHQARTITFVVPQGFHVSSLPEGGAVDGGSFGRATLEVTTEGKNKVIVKRVVVFNQHRIPPEQYAAWRHFIESVDALMHKTVRFLPEEK